MTTANAAKSGTEYYLEAFRNLLLVPRTICNTRSQRGSYRNLMLRTAKEHQQKDEKFWNDASLAMVHAWIATAELSAGIETFDNTDELGEWDADELDADLSDARMELSNIISEWLHQSPHDKHPMQVLNAAAHTKEKLAKCRSAVYGDRAWLACEDGVDRQAPCHQCPIATALSQYGRDAEDLAEVFEHHDAPRREVCLRETVKPVKQLRHPLDHVLAAVTAIARLDAATADTDPRHHDHLALAAVNTVQAIRHLSNLALEDQPDFPTREYAPYADALAAAVINDTDPEAADARYIPAPENRSNVNYVPLTE